MLSKNDTIDCRFVKWVALYLGTVALVEPGRCRSVAGSDGAVAAGRRPG